MKYKKLKPIKLNTRKISFILTALKIVEDSKLKLELTKKITDKINYLCQNNYEV